MDRRNRKFFREIIFFLDPEKTLARKINRHRVDLFWSSKSTQFFREIIFNRNNTFDGSESWIDPLRRGNKSRGELENYACRDLGWFSFRVSAWSRREENSKFVLEARWTNSVARRMPRRTGFWFQKVGYGLCHTMGPWFLAFNAINTISTIPLLAFSLLSVLRNWAQLRVKLETSLLPSPSRRVFQ